MTMRLKQIAKQAREKQAQLVLAHEQLLHHQAECMLGQKAKLVDRLGLLSEDLVQEQRRRKARNNSLNVHIVYSPPLT